MKISNFLFIIMLIVPFTLAKPQSKVTAKEITIKMSTAQAGFPNPNTPFLESGGRNEDVCYPIPYKHHVIREKPADIDWRIVVLENEFLRVEFAPELGGMIWRLYDKVHSMDVLHAPNKVFPTGDGFGGTYTPGGLELNYPYAHAVTNTWPRKTSFRENKDGSATYIVSEWERNGRTQWAMEFTLRKGESRLRQECTLYNRSKLPASFVYWGNARVPADGDTKWIYPEAMSSEHGGTNVFTWPVFRGIDLSLMINDPEVIGMYFLEPRYNFFGLTNLKTMSGMVHYGDWHDVPGKKLWNWGLTPSDGPRKWEAHDRSGSEPHKYGLQYGETQSGRIVNQDHLEWLMPEEFVKWEEAWSPIFGLTNVNEVTEDAAFQLKPEENKLLIYSLTPAADVKLDFLIDGKKVKEMTLTSKTSQLQEVNLSDLSIKDYNEFEVLVRKSGERSGSITSFNRLKQKKASELREIPIYHDRSTESLAVNAEFEHKLLFRQKAVDLYKKAIALDSLNTLAHLGLGKIYFANGDFNKAASEFRKSIQGYKWNAEAYLMLSHINFLLGNLDEAYDRAFEARYFGEKCTGNIKIAEVLISRGEYNKAKTYLEEALVNNSRSLRTYALLALCDRRLGNSKQALIQLDRSPQTALRDMMWYTEAYLSGRLDEKTLEKELFSDEWRFLEVSLDYLWLGAYKEADRIADLGIALHKNGWQLDKLLNPDRMWGFTRNRETPFLHLIKGYVAEKENRAADAERYYKSGDYFEHYVNFNQPEMVPVMQAAIKAGNSYADFWLGNYYYHSMRPGDAMELWNSANEKHPKNAQILRNLAVYEEFQGKNMQKARDLLKEALKIRPEDVFIRQELISAEQATGASPDAVLDIYLSAPKEQQDAYLFNQGLLQAFKDAGKWNEALEFLEKADRRYSEDAKSWYVFCLDYAENLLENGKPADAQQWITKGANTPANLTGNRELPVEQFYRQREYFIMAQAYKALGDDTKSKEFFRKVIDEPNDFLFYEGVENRMELYRFYAALSMKELGMEQAATGTLVGINNYRLKYGLVTLKLNPDDLKLWSEKDPLAEPGVSSH